MDKVKIKRHRIDHDPSKNLLDLPKLEEVALEVPLETVFLKTSTEDLQDSLFNLAEELPTVEPLFPDSATISNEFESPLELTNEVFPLDVPSTADFAILPSFTQPTNLQVKFENLTP
jgi:hypothetical protein